MSNLITKFEFISGEIPSNLKFSGKHCLYNLTEYLNIWTDIDTYSYFIVDTRKNEMAGYIQFQVIGKKAVSQYMAPFGSLSISNSIDFEKLSAFTTYFTDHLKNVGIEAIIIKHYPGFYHPKTSEAVISSLGLNGFTVSKVDINHYIKVSETPFSLLIHPMELRILNKCTNAGIIFKEYPNTEAELVFRYIESFRKAKGIPVNIKFETLKKLTHKFPDKYKFYTASINKEIIAATICVMVNQSVLYNFLPAHNENYNNYSPMIFLMDNIYAYASLNNYSFIDLGISSVDGIAQSGLIKFKERLGGKAVSKLTFSKVIQ